MKRVVISAIAAVVLFAPSAGAATIWEFVPSPNRGTDFNRLNAVTAVSPTDVWAVGLGRRTPTSQLLTLVLHSDGSVWSLVRSPSVGTSTNELRAVDAAAADDVWAVGQTYAGTSSSTLAEHYDGTAWSVVPTPNFGAGYNMLTGVAAIADNDVWAVGSNRNGNFTPLAMHYDGSAWTVVPTPVPLVGAFLNAVVVVAPNDVWAVGGTGDDGDDAFILHWNGGRWKQFRAPPLLGEDSLSALAAVASPTEVWAVGHVGSSNLSERWDGTTWLLETTPNPLPTTQGNNFLTGVVVLGPGDVWAVGATLDFTAGSLLQTTTLHFVEVGWSTVDSPNEGTGDNLLLGATTPGPGQVVAVGGVRFTRTAHDHTLVMATSAA